MATYSVHFSTTTNIYHYDARLLRDGRAINHRSGCSIGPMLLGYNRASCIRQAKRAARRLLKHQLEADSQRGAAGTITAEEIA